jgi:hypothetical protein
MTENTELEEEKPHGPAIAGYSNMTWPQTPWIECLCGWESSMGNHTWRDVGEEFDSHLNA